MRQSVPGEDTSMPPDDVEIVRMPHLDEATCGRIAETLDRADRIITAVARPAGQGLRGPVAG
jgi:hypothetical protein